MNRLINRHRCPEHGWVMGECRICEGMRIRSMLQRGLIELKQLKEGMGPDVVDPTPMQIRFRCFQVRMDRERFENGKWLHGSRSWKARERIVRICPDPEFQ
jgi:hypothetical protein